jgi:hypothetical protein
MKPSNHATARNTMAKDRRTSRAPAAATRSRHTGHGYRRRSPAMAGMPDAQFLASTSALMAFLDEHAVKTGMIVFYAWFVLANWTRLLHVTGNAASYLFGAG